MERRSIRKVPYKRLVKSKLINTDMSEFLFAYAKMINSKLIENYQNKDELLTSENNNFFSQEEIIDYFQTLAEDAESFECIKFHLSSLQEFMSFPQEVWVLSLLYQTKITQKFNFPLINSN